MIADPPSVTASGPYDRYVGVTGAILRAHAPLDRETVRRFVQATMDSDPLYHDEAFAAASREGTIVAPALYPVHAFRTPAGAPDPLAALWADPDADGTQGMEGVHFGLAPIDSPFKRLVNGGNEFEVSRCLAVGELCVAQARYASVELKQAKSGPMLVVQIETEFRTDAGDRLLISRQTLLWR
ncbi:FAS1-like dehydratase domain-containing protein [Ramlibacter sp.]|uniref:FAS1-like dehydratase domain-containing protein n=1 Tax=Ramlibacter sp. TaxID=1917967 RepID=UPI003D100C3D